MRENIKQKYKEIFDEVDSKFIKKKNNLHFINYILVKMPYKGYEEDKKNKTKDFSKESQDLIRYLQSRYHPDNYTYEDDEQSQLNYCLIEYISSYLDRMFDNF